MILTDAAVRRITPPRSGRIETWDAALPGFGLRCSASGIKSFVLVTRVRGTPIRLTWKYPATTLADARDLARAALQAIARGEDPRERKRPAPPRSPDAFDAVAMEFIEKWSKPRKRTWDEDERILAKYVTPAWTGRPITSITRADVVALVETIAEDNGPIQANRTLAVVKKLLSWSLDRGLIDTHPAARLGAPAPERTRDRVLTDLEIKALWKAWGSMGFPAGSAMKMLLLTGARRGEVQGMRWDEIDVDAATWTIPAERVKTKLSHVVPLSTVALELLRGVPRFDGCPFVFTRGRRAIGDWSTTVTTSTELAGINGWTTHDLRRTCRTGLARLKVPSDIAERVLGHVMPGVRGVYDRHEYLDETRTALEAWAQHVAKVVGDAGR